MSDTTFARGENPLRADKLNTAFSERVSRRGDTMQGMLTLWRDPSNPFDAATKQYVDRITVPPQDGIFTGPIYYTATGGNTPRSAQDRAADVFHIMDYGAKCDGVTDDTAAINATLVAAANSTAYLANQPITITGPNGVANRGSVVTSINATIFNRGNGANMALRVTIKDLSLICSGAGNICIDALGSSLLKFQNVSIKGVAPAPEIGLQLGVPTTSTSRAWNATDHVVIEGVWTFAAHYNFASEDVTYLDTVFSNSLSGAANIAPIGTFGTLIGGSGYVDANYNNVPLTGGTGSGALANLTVVGGIVTSIVMSYEGRNYTANDLLSASAANLGGTGSGFSVRAATVTAWALVLDGQNHWRARSSFLTVTHPVETINSQTLNTFINASIRAQGTTSGGLWMGWTSGVRVINSYIYNGSGLANITFFNNGVGSTVVPGPNRMADLEFNCEGGALTSMIRMTGSNPAPILTGLRFRGYHLVLSPGTTFSAEPHITSVRMSNVDISLGGLAFPFPLMWANPSIWDVSGKIAVHHVGCWNAPGNFSGTLIHGQRSQIILPYYQNRPADPTGTTSNAMMGLGASITPTSSGRVMVIVSGAMTNVTTPNGAQVNGRYGAGTVPVNGDAAAGTIFTSNVRLTSVPSNNACFPFTVSGIMGVVTPLTIGTTYWIDLHLSMLSGGTARVLDLQIVASEM